MQILGHFFVYLRPHDNMFTGLGGLGVILLFLLAISQGLTEGRSCPQLTQYAAKTLFPDYKLPYDLKR